MKKWQFKLLICTMALAVLSGCATPSNRDPLQGLNRGIYKFNDVADKVVMKPVATAYKTIAPTPVRTGFNNFFNNIGMIATVFNDLLQFKFKNAFTDAGRFVINSTFGLAGFVDVASMDNIPKNKEDFGQTLGHWGVGDGAYLVLPLIGPSSIRDATGFVVDGVIADPITYTHNIGEISLHNQLRAAQFIDKRTELLDAKDIVDNASLDPYAFTRDAYLQRRASQVQDGLVPQDLLKQDDGFEPADEDVVENAPAKAETIPEEATEAVKAEEALPEAK